VFFSPDDKTSPTIVCQTVSSSIAQIRILYAIGKVIGWIEGLVWPP
jgi:hypothetical protein